MIYFVNKTREATERKPRDAPYYVTGMYKEDGLRRRTAELYAFACEPFP